SVTRSALLVMSSTYSPVKNMPNFMPEYSTKYPATISLSLRAVPGVAWGHPLATAGLSAQPAPRRLQPVGATVRPPTHACRLPGCLDGRGVDVPRARRPRELPGAAPGSAVPPVAGAR